MEGNFEDIGLEGLVFELDEVFSRIGGGLSGRGWWL